MTESTPLPVTQQQLDSLRDAARAATSWDVVLRPSTASTFTARLRAAQVALKQLELDLASLPNAEVPTAGSHPTDRESALLELRGNFRLVRSSITGVSDGMRVV